MFSLLQVFDKIAARARGVQAVLTRQPIDGRANNGGQKFGEMEFDSFKAAGVSMALYDRSVLASDHFKTMICKSCGTMGEVSTPSLAGLVRGSAYVCRACEAENKAVEVDTVWCYSGLFLKELAAMNIGVTHHVHAGAAAEVDADVDDEITHQAEAWQRMSALAEEMQEE